MSSIVSVNLTLNDKPQGRQIPLHRIPDKTSSDIFVIVTIHIPGSGHLAPGNVWVSRFQAFGKTARRLGNNLQTTCDCIDRADVVQKKLTLHATHKLLGEVDVMQDIAKRGSFSLRRHKLRRRWRPVRYEA